MASFIVSVAGLWGLDMWSDIILDVALRVFFFNEINILISRLEVKQIALPNAGGPHPIS